MLPPLSIRFCSVRQTSTLQLPSAIGPADCATGLADYSTVYLPTEFGIESLAALAVVLSVGREL